MEKDINILSKMLINGQWLDAAETFDDREPATGNLLSKESSGTKADIDMAVESARDSFNRTTWKTNNNFRIRTLYKISELIRNNREDLAMIEARDVGKFLDDARAEVNLSADLFEYYAGSIDKFLGETYTPEENKIALTIREPVGVVGAIVPWNYPLPLATLKVAPALAMGNSVVLKPPEDAPLSSLYLSRLIAMAGVPDGIINTVPGFGSTAGDALIHNRDVNLIAFTGSTYVGRKIIEASADRIGRVELELGGKSPQVIFSDADIRKAVEGVKLGMLKNAGQDCCAGSRILVQEDIYDRFMKIMRKEIENQKVGNPLVSGTTVGPVISKKQLDRIDSYVELARKDGANMTGGGIIQEGKAYGATFYRPALIENIDEDSRPYQEEIFGPVGIVEKFKTLEDAVKKANNTEYGLASAIWTSNISTAFHAARSMQAGMVWINEYYAHVMGFPFGGYKGSGIGKDYSIHALEAYSQLKEVTFRAERFYHG